MRSDSKQSDIEKVPWPRSHGHNPGITRRGTMQTLPFALAHWIEKPESA